MDTTDYSFQEQFGSGLLSTRRGWYEIPDWFSYARTLPTIEDELNRLVRPENVARTIYVMHMPPARLGLDVCRDGRQVGSEAIYRFLAAEQPMLSLHGHIHESPQTSGTWRAQLGRTLCIQPGQLDSLIYITADLPTLESNRHVVAATQAC
jgi:Icc-related predicted phosphoesterase